MADPIHDENEMRQRMFSTLRAMANLNLDLVYDDGGYLQYPWELIDQVQEDRKQALLNGNNKRVKKLDVVMETLRIWRNSLVELDNTIVPDENKNNWF